MNHHPIHIHDDDHQVGMKATDTALLGHLQEEGTTYLRCRDDVEHGDEDDDYDYDDLSAVAVADLWTSSTGVFIQVPHHHNHHHRRCHCRHHHHPPHHHHHYHHHNQGRVLGTFVGHAVGAGKPEMAGVWTQVILFFNMIKMVILMMIMAMEMMILMIIMVMVMVINGWSVDPGPQNDDDNFFLKIVKFECMTIIDHIEKVTSIKF